jgi:glycosyltransferase involved in cell wall biosynthesis
VLLKAVFWSSLGALAWTHAGYPLAAAVVASVRERRVRKADLTPTVAVIVAAHDEEAVIGRLLESLDALDYPRELLEIVVASDASTDGTDALVEDFASRDGRIRLVRCPRGGKVAAQDAAVRTTDAEILAFADAAAVWAPDALRQLVRNFADSEVAYVAGRVALRDATGTNREHVYWRYELWLRESESALGSVTGGNGAIYAVRRDDYAELDPRFGHDLAFPSLMVRRGRRAVYEGEAVALDQPARDLEDEFRRKVRMFEHCWLILFQGGILRGVSPLYFLQLVGHRVLRYGSGPLHIVVLGTNLALVGRGAVYEATLAAQLAWLALAAAGRARLPVPGARLAYYYLLVTSATVAALIRYARFGVPAVWEKVEGTR